MKGLVFDGGGVFGIGQAHIISNVDCLNKFDFFVGTSIGSAIALSIALEKNNVKELFYDKMFKIFAGHNYRTHIFWSNRYNDKQLNEALCELFSGSFGSCKKPVFITAVNKATSKLKVFNSTEPADSTWPCWEVIRTSVAAPTYFVPWKGYVDGGVYANNPSMAAISAAARVLDQKISNLEICSIGTGSSSSMVLQPWNRSGRIRWGLWVLQSLLSGGSNSMHEYFTRSVGLKKYRRIQFTRNRKWKMDNPCHMLEAAEAWGENIKQGIEIVKKF